MVCVCGGRLDGLYPATPTSHSVFIFSVLVVKRFLIRILVFLVVYVILHILVVCVTGPYVSYYRIETGGHTFSRMKEIPEYKNPDILFLGSSHAYRGFDPRIFDREGIGTFNLGSSSQTPLQTEVLLKKYLDEIHPSFIVFDVYPVVFQLDGIESTADLISCDHIDVELCKLAINTGNLKVINTLIYGMYQEYVRGIRNTFQEKKVVDGDLYVSGGYVERLADSSYVPNGFIEPQILEIHADQLRAFGRCIQMIQERKIPYLLVEAPLPESTYLSMVNHEAFRETMSSFGTYIDFNDLMHLDDSCFYDANHLTQRGVELYDEDLIRVVDSLKTKGAF